MQLCFKALGRPAPQGSKVALAYGRMRESSIHLKPWRKIVKEAAVEARGAGWDPTFPMCVHIELVFARPQDQFGIRGLKPSAPKYHTKRVCDVDKGARAILDACTGVLFNDDSQVFDLTVSRRYCNLPEGEPEQAIITVEMVDPKA